MIRKFTFFLLLMFSAIFFAQIYTPLDTSDYAQRKEFARNYMANNELLIKDLKSKYSGKAGSELPKIYKELGKDFDDKVKNKDFTFNSVFDAKVKSLIERLRKNNPQIPQNLKILIAKNNTPNAFCFADGTFVINMGLFSWLNNDDQLASVISHELGHKITEHTLKAFLSMINQNQTDKMVVQNIKSNKVNRNQRAFDVLRDRIYQKGAKNRKQEMEADSLGYVVFKNSDFKKNEFINALKRLEDFDTISPRQLNVETYKKFFNLPKQEFNDKWLAKEDFSLYNYNNFNNKLNKDSLKSHPEVTLRINNLKKIFPELKSEVADEKASESYAILEKIARMETLPNFYHSEDYGLGIYTSLQFLQDGEEEKYYKNWLGKCFGKIYEARKNYNLNRYLDRVDPKNQSESYQQFLNFMWNLSLDEIKNIADYYQNKES
ncbi:M48 family metalloprotease [Chryseobacterium wangxinyae]|uniref:M48 family metalloprotease n=1 Tax=Chryseobacterium sp. CY350 TaxID=2997336 RepID=UPI0022704AB6|nr:M48 family metalloprotease [Chryseobacterium sp. CY350]MCY0975933.1 M48 family metalloprotease [Chryseobacterium sp. CY350]WBZ94462.1 M48 family metalloprotease [Chryseobacterium sp. CY350]